MPSIKDVTSPDGIFMKSTRREPKVLDLFAGAGGLSEGFVRNGCEIIGHIEMEKDACSTLVTRMIYHALKAKGQFQEYRNYILGKISRDSLIEKYGLQKERDSVLLAKIERGNYKNLIDQVKQRLDGAQLDVIVGGPPCQAYSHIGRARDDKNMKWDRRNYLYRYYIEFLKALRPKIFVFENVPGLRSAGGGKYLREMRKLMKQTGYETDFRILNAADFGVPQNRKRIILVGWNNKSSLKHYPEFPLVTRNYTVGDFFSDLPKLRPGEGQQVLNAHNRHSELLTKLAITNPRLPELMDHIARPNTKQDLEIYRRALLARNNGKLISYKDLPKILKTHSNEDSFTDRFKVVDGKARGSQTVVAHIAKDGHYYIHPDAQQNRSITVREAARLQTFPDDFKFEGSRTSQFRQIGNAVPVMLADVIAKELVKHL